MTMKMTPKAQKSVSAPAPDTSTETTAQILKVPPLRIKHITLHLLGVSPIIFHNWSEKAKAMMRDKQQKKVVATREKREPYAEFMSSLYHMDGSTSDKLRVGFPATGFKSSAVDACGKDMGVPKTVVRTAFHVFADEGDLVEIKGKPPVMREDMVRVGMGSSDLRYRGMMDEWTADLRINYDVGPLSVEQLINIFNRAGYGVGVGEWRPSTSGSFGRFMVTGYTHMVNGKPERVTVEEIGE